MKTLDLCQLLQQHPYPGRGIVLGRSADDQKAVIAYFIMAAARTAATVCSRPLRTASAPGPTTSPR